MKNFTFFTMALFAILSTGNVHADTWRVNNNPLYTDGCGHCFSNLQDAVNSTMVSPGDTIHLEASNIDYSGVDITKQLTIIGKGFFLDENLDLQNDQTPATIQGDVEFQDGSEGSQVTGVVFEGPNADVGIYTSDITISRCHVDVELVFRIPDTEIASNISITQCYLYRIDFNPNLEGPINNLLISNNYISWRADLRSTYDGFFTQNVVNIMDGGNSMTYFNNIITADFSQNNNNTSNVFNNIFTDEVPEWLEGSSNVYVAEGTVFVAEGSTDGILQVNPSNICPECYQGYYPGGPNDIEIGMFGGNTPYVLSGIPNIPTVYELHNSANVYQSDTTHVTIGTRSNY